MKVQIVGLTHVDMTFDLMNKLGWRPEGLGYEYGGDGQDLAEFAGRACYQAWGRKNPATATNEGYLRHIIEVGHGSVLEHATVTFYIEGVSRSLTHEFIRHRHLSPSQLSQRFVDESGVEFVVPPLVERSELAQQVFTDAVEAARTAYETLVAGLTTEFPEASRKEIREAARSVLPNATETKIVMTGNYRAWRHFISLRATPAADAEIRLLAEEILRQLKEVAPNAFQDFVTPREGQ